jgi:hypothetical protein
MNKMDNLRTYPNYDPVEIKMLKAYVNLSNK